MTHHFYQKLRTLFFFSIIIGSLLDINQLRSSTAKDIDFSEMSIEIAHTAEQKMWGLMQRRSLPSKYGMLFVLNPGKENYFWSFNCFVDITLVFLDQNFRVLKSSHLQPYPHKMSLIPPILDIQALYTIEIPQDLKHFFIKKSIKVPKEAFFAIEVAYAEFKPNYFQIGDYLLIYNHP